MKRIILPVLAYLVCMLPVLLHKTPRSMQILTSKVEFRTLTFGQTYTPEGAAPGVAVTDSLIYVCPATGSDPFTLQSLQLLLAREVLGFTTYLSPASFGQVAKANYDWYIDQYEKDAYAMRESPDDGPLYTNAARRVETRLDYNSPRLLVVEMNRYYYGGNAAHGIYEIRRMSIRLNGSHTKVLQPRDLFTQRVDSTALLNMVKKELLASNGCRTAEELQEKTCIDLAEVKLTPNVSIDPQGLTFIYQPYEIACYAGGAPRVTLPMSWVRPWLKSDVLKLFAEPAQ